MPAISRDKLTAAHQRGDTEAVGRMILDLAGAIVGEHVIGRRQIDKYDSDDLQSELALYVLGKLPRLRNPDRLFSFAYQVMTRRLFKLLGRARSKDRHASRYRQLTGALYPAGVLMMQGEQ